MKCLAYYRVSMRKQEFSEWGLEAQRAMVQGFIKRSDKIIAEYTEVESTRRRECTELSRAIEHAKRAKATLLIAKLDQLARDGGLIFALRDSGVKFVCCDIPEANTLTIGIFAVLAQHERELISKRTRDALAAKKARGAKLGTPANLTDAARRKGREAHARKAREHTPTRQAAEMARLYRASGCTYAEIADRLNTAGYHTRHSKQFYAMTAYRLLQRK